MTTFYMHATLLHSWGGGGGGGGKEKEIPGLEEKKLEGSNAILAHLLHFFFVFLMRSEEHTSELQSLV